MPLSKIALHDICPNPDQPRKIFDAGDLSSLAASIREQGLIQPITVRPFEHMGKKAYQIVVGERRWRASMLNHVDYDGPATILCNVSKKTLKEAAMTATIENLQRVNLTPLEEARDFQHLVDLGYTAEQIARETGAVLFKVQWRLRLLNLAPQYQKLLAAEQLDRQSATEMARLNPADQDRVFRMVNGGKLIGWKAVRNVVEAILGTIDGGLDLGAPPPPSLADARAVASMESRIDKAARAIGAGWKDGECLIAAQVDPNRAGKMAYKIAAMQSALRVMERELRNVAAPAQLRLEAA